MVTRQSVCRYLQCTLIWCILLIAQSQVLYSQANVLIFSSGDPHKDSELGELIAGYGHKVILGVEFPKYTGGGLTGVDVVLLQAGQDWSDKDMPSSGQRELLDFVASGGGLITTRPVLWNMGEGSEFAALRSAFPAVPENVTSSGNSISYAQNSLDSVLNAGLPAYFSFETGSRNASETHFAPRPGATVFFESGQQDSNKAAGVIGWNYGAGRVLSLSALLDEVAIKDANCSRLLHNSIVWTTPIPEPSAGLMAVLVTVAVGMRRRRKSVG